jgi:prolyl-tRNA synthetase
LAKTRFLFLKFTERLLEEMAYNKQLPKMSEDVSGWYNAIVLQAELADYGPAKGTMIVRPYGYSIWEQVHDVLDPMFKAHGVENTYFPLFIPERLINKEASHLEGFAPELAVVTIGGGEELTEKLVVRPTSETIMYDAYSRWIGSWRDLPVMMNQWNSAVRWEKRTYMFLRTTEFLWQEGHTAHATHEDARSTQVWAMDCYSRLFREFFALPGYIGLKSSTETFAGADGTMTYESLMPGGKALQTATSHDLGQNFAKAFDVTFQNKEGKNEHVWQTSWGVSTRALGGLFLAHGDDKGLKLPPKVAPTQVVIIPVRNETTIVAACNDLAAKLTAEGIRTKIDKRDGESIGFKMNKWELKGVPLRVELGQREIDDKVATVARRDNGEKTSIALDGIGAKVKELLAEIQSGMLAAAEHFLSDNTHTAKDYKEFKSLMGGSKGFIEAHWCGNDACETAIKEQTTATTRCKSDDTPGQCIYCGKEAGEIWYFAQSY